MIFPQLYKFLGSIQFECISNIYAGILMVVADCLLIT